MAKYVAFLKAINVGGHVVKMDELRELFSAMKFSNVETFIASGNVIFETKAEPDREAGAEDRKAPGNGAGIRGGDLCPVDGGDSAISEYQPFSKKGLVLNVAFLRQPLTAGVVEKVMGCAGVVDDFHVHGREVYWLCQIRQSGFEISHEEVRERSAAKRPGAT